MGYTLRRVNAAIGCGLQGIVARIHSRGDGVTIQTCCGLQGIVARIHSLLVSGFERGALWLAGNRRSDTLTTDGDAHPLALWLAGNRRSDTLRDRRRVENLVLWLAGNRRSDTLTTDGNAHPLALWLAGNRRSDTLAEAWAVVGPLL